MNVEVNLCTSIWHFQTPAVHEATAAWEMFSAITSNLSQELCEQLRLVLEPTQATRLKGDFRTGRRINMRKVSLFWFLPNENAFFQRPTSIIYEHWRKTSTIFYF